MFGDVEESNFRLGYRLPIARRVCRVIGARDEVINLTDQSQIAWRCPTGPAVTQLLTNLRPTQRASLGNLLETRGKASARRKVQTACVVGDAHGNDLEHTILG
ncbi:MAG: hypothetical protein CMJ34_06645 [Phycisphaerae bacterium]|nr:hypothetical protein [Phycisphaerae bacterium]